MRVSEPKKAFTNASSEPFSSAKLTSLSTSRPSTWWNMGVWVMSESRRYTRPGTTTRTGGLWLSM